jgi:hypothetical protein
MQRNVLLLSVASILVLFAAPFFVQATAANSNAAASCLNAGGTGLTTLMILNSNTVVHGKSINAKGCDVGIYIPPGSSNVKITGTTITGANDEAIFAQDSSNILVQNNFIWGNGVNGGHSCNYVSAPCIAEDKAIQFAGVSNSKIVGNVVRENTADGGIGVTTDGPAIDPAALKTSATANFWAKNNAIESNTIVDNVAGCGIVLSAYNPMAGTLNNWISDNSIVGVSPYTYSGVQYVGQIVVATDGPYTTISGTHVLNNHIDGSLLPGIVVHANVFGDLLTKIWIEHNVVSENGWYPPSFATGSNDPQAKQGAVGIALISEHNVQPKGMPNPVLSNAYVEQNTILSDNIGVWHCFVTSSVISAINGNSIHSTVACPGG